MRRAIEELVAAQGRHEQHTSTDYILQNDDDHRAIIVAAMRFERDTEESEPDEAGELEVGDGLFVPDYCLMRYLGARCRQVAGRGDPPGGVLPAKRLNRSELTTIAKLLSELSTDEFGEYVHDEDDADLFLDASDEHKAFAVSMLQRAGAAKAQISATHEAKENLEINAVDVLAYLAQRCAAAALMRKALNDIDDKIDDKLAGEIVDADVVAWVERAAATGDPAAQMLAGDLYSGGYGVKKDETKAFAEYLEAAEQGDAEAQWDVAMMYLQGSGIDKDASASLHWLERAFEQGRGDAGEVAAQAYRNGEGTPKDEARAFAIQQRVGDEYGIAVDYLYGRGVEADVGKALEHLRKAVAQGAPFAGCKLGMLYLDPPKGVAREKVEAYRWILHEKGVWPECEKRLAKLMSEMAPAERARAEADPDIDPTSSG